MREFLKECPSIMDFSEIALPHDMPSNVSGYYIKVYKVTRFLGWVCCASFEQSIIFSFPAPGESGQNH
jgi:hypothetical protein